MALDIDRTLADFAEDPDSGVVSWTLFRLGRRVPELQELLGGLCRDELDAALLGSGPLVDVATEPDLGRAVTAGLAGLDRGQLPTAATAAALAKRAHGDLQWWVPATRLHVLTSPEAERRVRMELSTQDLPYVFPGELHPMQVALLAGGDQVVAALHIDWLRKLSTFVADALILDARAQGLWFWPLLRFLDEKKLARPLKKMAKARKLPPGSRGLMAAYLDRIGGKADPVLAAGDRADTIMCAVALASVRPGQGG